jgi:DNA uptake protein ComE-like DNA-binding protein
MVTKAYGVALAMTMVLTTVAAAQQRSASSAAPKGKINLNTASQAQLEKLPGVDAATAKKIMEGRPYASLDDLTRVGIPQSTIDQIRPRVLVGSPAHSPVKKKTTKKPSDASTFAP